MTEAILKNARVVLPDRVVEGAVVVRDGRIVAVDESRSTAALPGEDLAGDYLIPGLVELHTDHLENHYAPRPGVRWEPVAALQAHDAQIAGSGITTVFDAFRAGVEADTRGLGNESMILAGALTRAQAEDRLRADHFIHLRCEVSSPDVADEARPLFATGRVRLASLMDHSPGQRQFVDLDVYKRYYRGKAAWSEDELDAWVRRRGVEGAAVAREMRPRVAAMARDAGAMLASHDDATEAHVAEAVADGVTVSEFPTTLAAAAASRDAGLAILMGAPNVIRGGSHSGNVAAEALARAGLLDILSSDYVPISLISAAFRLPDLVETIDLPAAIGLVSRRPAEVAGLDDRGAILPGRRADLVRAAVTASGPPVVRSVWREGRRVA